MIKIKSITIKNFLSVGNQTQAVNFDTNQLTLVLGENLDLGGKDAGSKNGVGKSSLVNALSYLLYGQALTNIKKENLINKTNGKGMLVTGEFEANGISYKIQRGRKPNILKLFVNDQEQKSEDDDSQGDSRETQKHIETIFGMSHTMFKHLVALNTYTEPFLSLRTSDQREVIEQLLGITVLSEKSEALKILIKESKDKIQAETFKIDGIKKANENVQKSIDSLGLKSSAWESKKDADLEKLGKAIMQLESVDIETELGNHIALKLWAENNAKVQNLRKQKATLESAAGQASKSTEKYQKELDKIKNKTCPACEQELHDHKHEEMTADITKHLDETIVYANKVNAELSHVIKELDTILADQPNCPTTYYDTESDAFDHKNNLASLEKSLETKFSESNPYIEQIEDLKKEAIQEISWDDVNDLVKLRDHQELLHKLLTNKDSFIRKKIIDQNLSYLNKRLSYYIATMGLPHSVSFLNDLNVEITQLGQELDFDNLSRGERNRLILSLSFAFRDVWESLYQHINLLFVDELIDSGMDGAGVEAGLAILKKMARERSKNIFLISHREELIGRVNTILKVIKENGFTSFDDNPDPDYVGPT